MEGSLRIPFIYLIAFSIFAVTSQLVQGGADFSYGFNDYEAMFPPKGKKPNDHISVDRFPSETRPLKCKNHDSSVLAGDSAFVMSRKVQTERYG